MPCKPNVSGINKNNAKKTLRDCAEMVQLLDHLHKRKPGLAPKGIEDLAEAYATLAQRAGEILAEGETITP